MGDGGTHPGVEDKQLVVAFDDAMVGKAEQVGQT